MPVKLKHVLVALMVWTILPATSQAKGPKMDVVFMLDISGSTGGILTSVRSKFWEIQNEIARLEPQPDFRFGLVCMGRPSFLKENDYCNYVGFVDKGFFNFYYLIDGVEHIRGFFSPNEFISNYPCFLLENKSKFYIQ